MVEASRFKQLESKNRKLKQLQDRSTNSASGGQGRAVVFMRH